MDTDLLLYGVIAHRATNPSEAHVRGLQLTSLPRKLRTVWVHPSEISDLLINLSRDMIRIIGVRAIIFDVNFFF